MRTKRSVIYHGRTGHPVVHRTSTGKKFMMTRARDGGTRRVYSGTRIRTTRTGAKGRPKFATLRL